jgi:hypothetical protein
MNKKQSKAATVKVRLLTSVAGRDENGRLRSYADGDVYECSPAEAERMIRNHRAVAIDETKASD